MVVHLLIGQYPAELTQQLRERAEKVASPIWLVPNEYHSHDDRCLTFPQLALKLAAPAQNQVFLSDPQERMLLRHVAESLIAKRKLKDLQSTLRTPGGMRLVFDFIAELKTVGAEPDRFGEFSAEAPGRRGIDAEIQLLYQSYDDLLREHNHLDRAAIYRMALQRKNWPKLGDELFVDGFANFRPPELAMLTRLSNQLKELWLTLPGDEESSERFAPVSQADVIAALQPVPPIPLPGREGLGEGLASTFAQNARKPLGLRHLIDYIFTDTPTRSDQSVGLQVIEAPGVVGEVRMIVRAIKTQINQGLSADSILVAVRHLGEYADLIEETFNEYEIPFFLAANLPLSRIPVIAGLLKATAVAHGGFQFADVSALLRSSLFHPDWSELAADAELPLAADVLLRQLEEPRGRDAFLTAAERWAAAPPIPLEDEEAEKTQQARTHELAKRCLPFLQKFFALWDDAPKSSLIDDHVKWFADFANRLGWPGDEPALQQLHADLAGWAEREKQIAPRRVWSHEEFLDQLNELASLANRPRSEAASGQVRVMSADAAAGLSYDHLYLPGLGERGFPDLSRQPNLYDEAERIAFRGVGLDLPVAAERLPNEKLLFLRLISGAQQTITFSYPATDELGQELLPGSFLRTIREDLFKEIGTHSQKMLIEGLDAGDPLSPAERRIRFARKGDADATIPSDLNKHLAAAKKVGQQRYSTSDFGPFDGMLRQADVRKDVARRFGPDRPLSPTSLETYIACPFKFFASKALKLDSLVEPIEEIEAHRRGSAYHRALTRLHRRSASSIDAGQQLSDELAAAVLEYADRAGSKTTKILWQLEMERLQRSALNYTSHADKHAGAWKDVGRVRAELLEEKYQIVVTLGDQRMKLGGRIDRVDVIETDAGLQGFLVIDYKTGKTASYPKTKVQSLERLQLAVYALAAEHRLGDIAPLGLLYWLPMDIGPKPILVGDKLAWSDFRPRLQSWLIELAHHIRAGEFPLQPRTDDSCNYCEYRRMCRIAQGRPNKDWRLPLPMIEGDLDE